MDMNRSDVQIMMPGDPGEKRRVARAVLEALTDWFEIEETRENYIEQSGYQPCFAAMQAGEPVGFLCLKETGDATVEIAVMGVVKRCHRQGRRAGAVHGGAGLGQGRGLRLHAGQDREDGRLRGLRPDQSILSKPGLSGIRGVPHAVGRGQSLPGVRDGDVKIKGSSRFRGIPLSGAARQLIPRACLGPSDGGLPARSR